MASGSRTVRRLNFGTCYVIEPIEIHKATIVWLHDLDHIGRRCLEPLKDLNLPSIKWICPTAPRLPVTSLAGQNATAWCDITKVSESMQHDFESLDSVNSYVADLLSTEPTNVIKGVGGVGLGAAAALYFASSCAFGKVQIKQQMINPQIVIGINGWLPGLTSLQPNMNNAFGTFNRAKLQRILLLHGTSDDVVPSEFGYKCAVSLRNNEFPTMFKQCGGNHVMTEICVWLTQTFGL
ncbi:hypothetical protein BRARA_F00177 [Brassica rapa]|uniref:Phospholipase/carboxylesterase/thioesterase domain-containing protein n=3 Tax=Brassica TaxID=3705 RepID=A0A397YTH5_BRACM|nr:acyl-protein thioesterase 2 isoform X2 [Brassica rapa]RID56752.1 hypothetical protein BRARA_F00177 [Brassica rapa]